MEICKVMEGRGLGAGEFGEWVGGRELVGALARAKRVCRE